MLADDHTLVRAGIRALLKTLPGVEVVGEFGDGLEALDCVRREPPDAILMDITLPGLNGLDVAARIKRLGLPTRVLMLSMHNSPEHAARALAAGAAGISTRILRSMSWLGAGRNLFGPALLVSCAERGSRAGARASRG